MKDKKPERVETVLILSWAKFKPVKKNWSCISQKTADLLSGFWKYNLQNIPRELLQLGLINFILCGRNWFAAYVYKNNKIINNYIKSGTKAHKFSSDIIHTFFSPPTEIN